MNDLNELEKNFSTALDILRKTESEECASIKLARRELVEAMHNLTTELIKKTNKIDEILPEYQIMAMNSFDEFLKIGIPFDLEQIRSSNRKQHLVMQRKHISIFLRNKGYSFNQIGNFLNRSHCSIIHLALHSAWDQLWPKKIEVTYKPEIK